MWRIGKIFSNISDGKVIFFPGRDFEPWRLGGLQFFTQNVMPVVLCVSCFRCQSKTVYLEAADPKSRMYWLRQLQDRRRRYSRRKTSLLRDHQKNTKTVQVGLYPLLGIRDKLSSQMRHCDVKRVLHAGRVPIPDNFKYSFMMSKVCLC